MASHKNIINYLLIALSLIPVQIAGFLTNDLQGLFSFYFMPLFALAAIFCRLANTKPHLLRVITTTLAIAALLLCAYILSSYAILQNTVGFFGTSKATPVEVNIAGGLGLAMLAIGTTSLTFDYIHKYGRIHKNRQ
ncbi:MAG: hypothetical protein PVI21_03940 [Candidatus Woesebacteria bacterium]|jgi:hypothetical protein